MAIIQDAYGAGTAAPFLYRPFPSTARIWAKAWPEFGLWGGRRGERRSDVAENLQIPAEKTAISKKTYKFRRRNYDFSEHLQIPAENDFSENASFGQFACGTQEGC